MPEEKPLRVTICQNSLDEGCVAGCGEPIDFIIQHLERRYGKTVILEQVDLANHSSCEQNQQLVRDIRQNQLPLPLLAVNGIPKIYGRMDFRMVSEVIETLREAAFG
ncbi:MAG: hypothetical protein HY664_08685 [Chloroflexi bacterium]|nr:hypothetical protein [Chloroflexota bacterium]